MLVLCLVACTSLSSNGNIKEQDSTNTVLQDTAQEVIRDSVIISENNLIINDIIIGHSIVGKPIISSKSISLDYDHAIVSDDTLIFVTDEKKLLPLIDFHDIHRPKTEKQIRDIMGNGYKVLKTVEDSDLVNNTDGNFEIPYLFLVNKQDSLQYMMTFPFDYEKTPYTYEFCEAKFHKNSKNPIATTIANALSKCGIMDFVKRYPRYKYIWLIPTSCEDDFREWSIFVWYDDNGISQILISIAVCDEILYNIKMSSYMYGLE